MMAEAFVEVRTLLGGSVTSGDVARAYRLAYTFHNLPRTMYGWGTWDVNGLRTVLQRHRDAYPDGPDYVAMLNAVFRPAPESRDAPRSSSCGGRCPPYERTAGVPTPP